MNDKILDFEPKPLPIYHFGFGKRKKKTIQTLKSYR